MSLLLANDGNEVRSRNLRSVPVPDYESRVRIDGVVAVATSEKELRKGTITLPSNAGVELSLEPTIASWAVELSVELVLLYCWCRESVFITLDQLVGELGVHLFEGTHGA